MRKSFLNRLIARSLRWWVRLRHGLREYERRNLAEWTYWGRRRAARELGQPDLATVPTKTDHLRIGCKCTGRQKEAIAELDAVLARNPASAARIGSELLHMSKRAITAGR